MTLDVKDGMNNVYPILHRNLYLVVFFLREAFWYFEIPVKQILIQGILINIRACSPLVYVFIDLCTKSWSNQRCPLNNGHLEDYSFLFL